MTGLLGDYTVNVAPHKKNSVDQQAGMYIYYYDVVMALYPCSVIPVSFDFILYPIAQTGTQSATSMGVSHTMIAGEPEDNRRNRDKS